MREVVRRSCACYMDVTRVANDRASSQGSITSRGVVPTMDRTSLLTRGFLGLAALALGACSSASAETDMHRDLHQASLSSMEVAPAGAGRPVTTAILQA